MPSCTCSASQAMRCWPTPTPKPLPQRNETAVSPPPSAVKPRFHLIWTGLLEAFGGRRVVGVLGRGGGNGGSTFHLGRGGALHGGRDGAGDFGGGRGGLAH